MPLQIRRGLEAERSTLTSLNGLVVGELLYTTDGKKLYVGPGPGVFGDARDYQGVAITGYTDEDAQDAAASLFTSGTHNNITFTYDDGTARLNATVELSNYGGAIAGDLTGSVYADGSALGGLPLIDGTEGVINLNGTVNGNVVPKVDSTYDLGSSSYKFKDLYLSGSSIHLGSALITSTGSAVNLPAGSTIGGEPLNSPFTLTELSANIVADDSTIMVNTTTKDITAGGRFYGNLTGNVTGDLAGNVTGDITGTINATGSNRIFLGNGSAAAPSIAFNSDGGRDTGFYWSDDGYINIANNAAYSGRFGPGTLSLETSITAPTFNGDLTGDVSGSLSGGTVSATSVTTSSILGNTTITINSNTAKENIVAYSDSVTVLSNTSTSDISSHPKVIFKTSKGTNASPTTIGLGEYAGGLQSEGWDGSAYQMLGGISISSSSSTLGSTAYPGKITLYVKDDDLDFAGMVLDSTGMVDAVGFRSAGVATSSLSKFLTKAGSAANLAGAMVYDTTTNNLKTYHATQGWGVIQTSTAPHQLPVYADDAARSAAISSPAAGMMVFMTSGTSPSVTNKVVAYDGSAWVALH